MKITTQNTTSGRYIDVVNECGHYSYLINDAEDMRKVYSVACDQIRIQQRRLEHFRAIMAQEMPDLLTELYN